MFKQFYIRLNLKIYKEIKILLVDLETRSWSDKSVTDNLTVEDIAIRMTDEYKDYISLPKKWESIREDNVLLTGLRDELKKLMRESINTHNPA